MKQYEILGIVLVLFMIILSGCSQSRLQKSTADETIEKDSAESIIEVSIPPTIMPTIMAKSTPIATPTTDESPINKDTTVTTSEVLTLTPVPRPRGALSMTEISEEYMSNIEITEDCPPSVSEKRDDVTYGTVVHKTYDSTTTGLTRGVNIILPANYNETKKYPVLYLLHGIGGNEFALLNDANSNIVQLIGNLISEGEAAEMIVVLPNIFATTVVGKTAGFDKETVDAYDNFIYDLTKDLMPYIEENYSILQGRENQAIAGFSMGGREAIYIGFTRPDLFGYVTGIAPAPGLTPGKDWAMEHPGQLEEDELVIQDSNYIPYVIMICCGTKDGVVGSFPKSYHDILTNNGVKHIWFEVPEADHDGKAIRSGLYNFCTSIFPTTE